MVMAGSEVPDYGKLKSRVEALARGPARREAVEFRVKALCREGIPKKIIVREELVPDKKEILERVQKRAEEYYQVTRSCSKSPALAVMEEFGFGDIKVITALTACPGVALTGQTCGAVLGGMAALSAYFGSDDILDFGANQRCFAQARSLLFLFEKALGTAKCYRIHEDVVFGRYYDLADMEKGRQGFIDNGGFEKCALPPGISARIAAQLIIEDKERSASGDTEGGDKGSYGK